MGRRSRRGHLLLLASALAAAGPQSAVAQAVGARASVNRASVYGSPSQQVERVGGRYTQYDVAGGAQRGAVATARFGLGFPRSPVQHVGGYLPSLTQLGPIPSQYYQTFVRTGALDVSRAGWMARFTSPRALDTPLGGWGRPVLPLPDTPLRVPERRGSRFGRIFGLVPATEAVRRSEPMEFEDVTAAVEAQTGGHVRQMEQEGLVLFRDATAGTLEPGGRYEKLRRAIRLFTNVSSLDAEAYVPCLLAGHACLERGQVSRALVELIEVAQRRPEAFHEGLEVASYFGDVDGQTGRSRRLDDSMREYVRRMAQGRTVDSCVLGAYCAMVLGQQVRAGEALDRAEDLLRQGSPGHPHIRQLLEALRYALS